MKHCLDCGASHHGNATECPVCGAAPQRIDGMDAYAPPLMTESEGFKKDYFADLACVEAGNFWFRSRNELILWALEKYAGGFQSLLEVGCGTGYVLTAIRRRFPTARVSGSEIFTAALKFAARRLPGVQLMQMDARRIPFDHEFDVVAAFDVLEHITEDEVVLSEMHRAIKPGGRLILTVPQHAWLWSAADKYACHKRRYSSKDLHTKIVAAGFEILRSTSFVTAPLPAMMLSRLAQHRETESFDPLAEFRISPWANKVLETMLTVERTGIRAGVNYPVGGSRLVVAAKPVAHA